MGIEPAALYGTIYPGKAITVGNSVAATAGPRNSTTSFSTCGHAAVQAFNLSVQVDGINIGTISAYTFGTDGDRAAVSLSSTAFYDLPSTNCFVAGLGNYTKTYSYTTSLVGTSVEMHGAVSSRSTGQIESVDTTCSTTISGTTYIIQNQIKASYTCQAGDSGAGVFSLNAINSNSAICYGIQSSGMNKVSGVYTSSFFSQFDPLYNYWIYDWIGAGSKLFFRVSPNNLLRSKRNWLKNTK